MKKNPYRFTRHGLAVTTTLLAAGAFVAPAAVFTFSASAVRADGAPAQTATALHDAKTVQVKETFSALTQTGQLIPYLAINAQVERPGKVRMDVTPITKPGAKTEPASQYISDGTKQHEFNGPANKYINSDAPAPGERATSELARLTDVDLLLNSGQLPPPQEGIKRTTGSETLDGKAMTVVTDARPPRKMQDGSSAVLAEKLWTDAHTGLPYRHAITVTQGDKTQTVRQWDFTGWNLNKPIPSAQFAWTPPAGATEFVEPKLLAVGTPAPDFEAIKPDGKTVHLSDYKGKTLVLDFWATWCGPCQQSMPHLEQVYQQVKDKGVAVLGVCVSDDKANYDKWVAAKKTTYTFQTAFDPAGRSDKNIALALYGAESIPTQYVIDKDGKVAAVNVGYEEGDHQLEAELAKLGVDIAVPQKSADSAK